MLLNFPYRMKVKCQSLFDHRRQPNMVEGNVKERDVCLCMLIALKERRKLHNARKSCNKLQRRHFSHDNKFCNLAFLKLSELTKLCKTYSNDINSFNP